MKRLKFWLVQPLWKTVWRILKKLKIELPFHPAIVLLGIYPKNTKILIQRDTCTPKFRAKMWKQPKCPLIGEWIKKLCVYTMEYYSAIKKRNLAICNNMDAFKEYNDK